MGNHPAKQMLIEFWECGRSWRGALDCKSSPYGELVRIHPLPPKFASVAQLDRAAVFETVGWEFESRRGHQI